MFERSRPDHYLTRLAASDLGQSYKSLALDQLGIQSGNVVVDLGCGPGADLSVFARAAGPACAYNPEHVYQFGLARLLVA